MDMLKLIMVGALYTTEIDRNYKSKFYFFY